MITSKKLALFASFSFSLFASYSFGQAMPPGQIVSQIDCNLKPGIDMERVAAWGRELPRDDAAANRIFYRQPVVKPYEYDYDFRIARYYSSWTEYVERSEAVRKNQLDSAPPRQRPSVMREDLMDCDESSRRIIRNRTVSGAGPLSEETLMTERFCRLHEGKTLQDAWARLSHIGERFQEQGDTNMIQMVHRAMGPGNGSTTTQGRQYVMVEVGQTPESIAARWDLTSQGFNPREGSEQVADCNYRALWRTHQIYIRDN